MRNEHNRTSSGARPRKRTEFFAARMDPVNGVPWAPQRSYRPQMGSSSVAANLAPGRVNFVSNVCPRCTRIRTPAGITTAGFTACSAAGNLWAGFSTNRGDASVSPCGAELSTGTAETTREAALPVDQSGVRAVWEVSNSTGIT
jgi:hypothetical protein